MESRHYFLQWLTDEGALCHEENVVHAERAFIANSVVNWCAEKRRRRVFTRKQIEHLMHILRKYLKGGLDLYWESGIIKIRDKNLPPKEKTNGCSSLADKHKK